MHLYNIFMTPDYNVTIYCWPKPGVFAIFILIKSIVVGRVGNLSRLSILSSAALSNEPGQHICHFLI